MMKRLLCTMAAALLLPAAASGQGNCTIISSLDTHVTNSGTPQQLVYVTQPVVSCPGGRLISSDQAYVSEASGSIQLMGNVQFQDSTRTMTAANAQYFSQMQRLSASGSVVVRHRITNSVIQSEQLEYLEATPQRTSLVQAMGGRPRAVMRQQGAQDSTVLEALQIDIIGEERLRGTGDAVLTRDSLSATGYMVDYVQADGRLDVSGSRARVETPGYQLVGDSITALLVDDDQLRDVFSRHGAVLEAEEMEVVAAAIRLFFEDGGLERMVAMQWQPLPGAEPAGQARVVNEQFRMVADSVDVLAPQQELREAVAIGDAYVERITPESIRELLPETEGSVTALIANDWMRGDTVRAFFVAADAPEDDVAVDADIAAIAAAVDTPAAVEPTRRAGGGERVMERLYASGEPAQAMHRMHPENATEGDRLSIAYLVGRHVEVTMVNGLVTLVTASEDVRGVYLQPGEAARRAAAVAGQPGGQP
jgi:lipopolysaccharide export system protein LptA